MTVQRKEAVIYFGDAVKMMEQIRSESVDLVFCDPIYPGIKREYGVISEKDWVALMDAVVEQAKRILKPSGSALFVVQPTSSASGTIRSSVWEFMAYWCDEWNMVQDLWWWNCTMLPTASSTRKGLCRPSLKPLVWLGSPDCYRNQKAILWEESDANRAQRNSTRCLKSAPPSGHRRDRARTAGAAERNGGVTPFNVWPIPHNHNASGHEAETPLALCEKVVKYLCPEAGLVVDPFAGRGNIGVAAINNGMRYIGAERDFGHFEAGSQRLDKLLESKIPFEK